MPSGRRHPQPESGLTFFLDRGLGTRYVADAVRSAGHVVLPMLDVYPDGRDQDVGDDEWIADVSAAGWIALTKDISIVRDHTAALAASTLRVFGLSNASLTGPQMAERYAVNMNRIVQRSRKPGPYVYVVMPNRLELRWRP